MKKFKVGVDYMMGESKVTVLSRSKWYMHLALPDGEKMRVYVIGEDNCEIAKPKGYPRFSAHDVVKGFLSTAPDVYRIAAEKGWKGDEIYEGTLEGLCDEFSSILNPFANTISQSPKTAERLVQNLNKVVDIMWSNGLACDTERFRLERSAG